jgi:hypothetical protein
VLARVSRLDQGHHDAREDRWRMLPRPMRPRLRAEDEAASSEDRSTVKAFAWGALVSLAIGYCGPHSYLRIAPGHLIGIWGTQVPEAHRITLCVGVACILALLAARAGRRPGIGIRVPMYAAGVVGLALSLITSFSQAGRATYKSGLGVRMQGVAAFMALIAVREAGGLGKPRRRRRNREGDQ